MPKTLCELKDEADYISRACDEQMALEAEQEARSIKEFKALVQKTIANGAGDEETALRWLSQGEKFYHIQDIESWVWDYGILFTDYGTRPPKNHVKNPSLSKTRFLFF